MELLRKYILKTGFVSVICLGLLVAFCQPVLASQSKYSFTDWLQANTDLNLSPQVSHKLAALSRANQNIDIIFKQAEKILIENEDNSDLPKNVSPETIHQYLLMQWNLYKTGKDMNAVTNVRTNKGLDSPITVKSSITSEFDKVLMKAGNKNVVKRNILRISTVLSRKNIVPLVNEISIGAP